MRTLSRSSAVEHVNRQGALLVFPVQNRGLPPSLWTAFFPKTPMHWAWDEHSDVRVGAMWELMKNLSDCGQVVYSKWYQGRATFFSRTLFTAMLCARCARSDPRRDLHATARELFEILQNNSPLSTKQLKEASGLQGRLNEAAYTRAMKQLFTSLVIVGFGEVEDGAFPSLAVGATELLFEDLWRDASEMSVRDAQATIERLMPAGSHFRRFFEKAIAG